MAKAAGSTKSQAIREYLVANKKANPKEIVAGLKEKGVTVSFGLANAVKYGKKGKKKARKVTAAKNTPAVSGSESIRQYISKHPTAKVKDIEKGLKSEGIKVSLSLVSAVKYKKDRKPGKKMRRMGASVRVAARKTATSGVTVEQLLEVKKLADSLGGAQKVRQALEALEMLR